MPRDTTIRVIIEGQDKTGPSFKSATGQAQGLFSSIGKGIATFTGAQLAANILSGAISSLAGAMTGLVRGSFQMAGTFQEMEFAALALGRSMGLTEQEIRGSIDALNEAGIRYDVAAKATATLARNQIDLSKSFDLARIAQATGILIGEDSSATMESLTRAVVTGNTFMLRRMGIMVNMTDVVKRAAESEGKAVEALSQRELAEIRLQAVIDNSAALMDVYEAAMESPTKAMRSLSGRVIPEMQAALGQAFLPAWTTVIKSVSSGVQAFTAAISEGGALYPIMVNLGAVASMVADAFSGLVKSFLPVEQKLVNIGGQVANSQRSLMGLGDTAKEAGSSFLSNLVSSLADAASSAFRGGIETVASLAEGIVQGVASSLSAVMNWLSGVLSGWLAPGSPPRIAKDIVQWGAETFTEYLQGFTEADFGLLEDLQGPIQNALQGLVSLGELGADQAGTVFKNITGELASAIDAFSETGQVDASIFEKLTDVGGRYGEQIAELARRQFEFAAASREVEQAQQALTSAMSAQESSQSALETIMEEFNTALREGASPDVLNAKRAEFRQAKAQLEQSKRAVKEAEAQNKAAEERTGPLREQASLQERLLRQLVDFTKVQKESTAAAMAGAGIKPPRVGAGAGAGALELPTFAAPTPADFQIGSSIKVAVDEAKAILQERMATLFEPITSVWAETVIPKFDEIKTQWTEITGLISQITTEKWPVVRDTVLGVVGDIHSWIMENWPIIKDTVLGVVEEIRTWFITNWPIIQGVAMTAWQVIRDVIGTVADIIVQNIWPALRDSFDQIKDTLEKLGISWDDVWRAIGTVVKVAIAVISAILIGLVAVITGIVNAIASLLVNITDAWSGMVDAVVQIVEGLATWLGNLFEMIKAIIRGDTDAAVEHFLGAWRGMVQVFRGIWDGVISFLQMTFGSILSIVGGFTEGVVGFFTNLYDRLVGHSIVPDMMREMAASVSQGFANVTEPIQSAWDGIKSVTVDRIGKTVGAVKKDWLKVSSMIEDPLDDAVKAVDKAWKRVLSATEFMLDSATTIIDEGTTVIKETIEEILLVIEQNWNQAWNRLRTNLLIIWDRLITQMSERVSRLASILTTAINQLVGRMRGAFNAIIGIGESFIDDFIQLGLDLIAGLNEGMRRNLQKVVNWFASAIQAIINKIRDITGIRSPSKVFEDIGQDLMRGLAKGIRGSIELPVNAVTAAGRGTVQASREVVNEFNFNVTATGDMIPSLMYGYETMRALASVTP